MDPNDTRSPAQLAEDLRWLIRDSCQWLATHPMINEPTATCIRERNRMRDLMLRGEDVFE